MEGLLSTGPTSSSSVCMNKNKFFLNIFLKKKKKSEKLVELVGGGSVINGAYPV